MLQNAEPHVTNSPIVSGMQSAFSAVNVQILRLPVHQMPHISFNHPTQHQQLVPDGTQYSINMLTLKYNASRRIF